MLMSYGFLMKVFEVFNKYKTPIDMVCTSEVGISMTIDNTANLQEIVKDLSKYGNITIDSGMTIICVVGNMEWKQKGFESKVINSLSDIAIRMISFGGSNYNISIVVQTIEKERTLNTLSKFIF